MIDHDELLNLRTDPFERADVTSNTFHVVEKLEAALTAGR
jgi:hypothetical protein